MPGAREALDRLKYEVAHELGWTAGPVTDERDWQQFLDQRKWEVAQALGLADQIRARGWGEMSSRDCGRIGGYLGGAVGGQMVRRMIQAAEAQVTGGPGPQAPVGYQEGWPGGQVPGWPGGQVPGWPGGH